MRPPPEAPLHLAARRGQLRGICFVLSHISHMDSAEQASAPAGASLCQVLPPPPRSILAWQTASVRGRIGTGGAVAWTSGYHVFILPPAAGSVPVQSTDSELHVSLEG